MQVPTSRDDLARALTPRPDGDRVLVMTMGALHDGHLQLVRTARARAGRHGQVVVTIFVNPLQFGADEDLDRYPRTLARDLELLRAAGVDVVFTPDEKQMYPRPVQVRIDPGPLGDQLEGAARPGHFAGVLTVVAKMFHLIGADTAVFGEKDYQQLVLIRRMADDLDLGVRVLGVPTVREADGLARSSRNRYLDPTAHERALTLSRALAAGARAASEGAGADGVLGAARTVFGASALVPDYLELRDAELGAAPVLGPARLLVAARVGATRLIDNVAVELASPGRPAAPRTSPDELTGNDAGRRDDRDAQHGKETPR